MDELEVARLRSGFKESHDLVGTSDGKTIFVRRWEAQNPKASLLILHGITAYSRPYGALMGQEMASGGVHFLRHGSERARPVGRKKGRLSKPGKTREGHLRNRRLRQVGFEKAGRPRAQPRRAVSNSGGEQLWEKHRRPGPSQRSVEAQAGSVRQATGDCHAEVDSRSYGSSRYPPDRQSFGDDKPSGRALQLPLFSRFLSTNFAVIPGAKHTFFHPGCWGQLLDWLNQRFVTDR